MRIECFFDLHTMGIESLKLNAFIWTVKIDIWKLFIMFCYEIKLYFVSFLMIENRIVKNFELSILATQIYSILMIRF